MSSKQTKRSIRKNIIRRFEESFDLERLDYERRAKPGKDVAKVMGLLFAAVLYLSFFGLVYYSWSQQLIDDGFMNKAVWIFMIPASVVGLFAFLITSNRREFPIREDIRAHVTDFEGENGLLWRYEPILNQLELKKIDIEGLVEASTEGRLTKMAPEDICTTIRALHQALTGSDPITNPNTLNQVESNFSDQSQAA